MKNSAIIALLLLLVMGACKKDQDDPSTIVDPIASKKLMGYTYENNQYNPGVIEYDAQGRVISFDDGEDKSTITYNGNEVKINEWRKSENREVYNFVGTLNAQGNLVEGAGVSMYNQGIVQQLQCSFEYDASGYMTRKIQNYNNGANIYDYKYTYEGGNLTSFKVYVNDVYDYGGVWEYNTTQKDRIELNWEQFGPPNTFTGKTNKNLASKYTGVRPGASSWFVDFIYTYDSAGYKASCRFDYWDGKSYKVFYQYQ